MQAANHYPPTGTLADSLYGAINTPNAPHGRAPYGLSETTETMNAADQQKTIAKAQGAHALITPKGNVFWAIALVATFLILNDKARR